MAVSMYITCAVLLLSYLSTKLTHVAVLGSFPKVRNTNVLKRLCVILDERPSELNRCCVRNVLKGQNILPDLRSISIPTSVLSRSAHNSQN